MASLLAVALLTLPGTWIVPGGGAAVTGPSGSDRPAMPTGDPVASAFEPAAATWGGLVNWTAVGAPAPPGGRAYMAFSAAGTDEALLFGGQGAGGASDIRGDTWLLTLSADSWTKLNLTLSPPARNFPASAYDPDAGLVVLFGGANATSAMGDTWLFSATNRTWWEVPTTTAPSPRYGAAFAWDAVSHLAVLVGGFAVVGPSPRPLSDWWTFSPVTGQWTNVTRTGGPSARGGAMLEASANVSGVILFGGAASPAGDNALNDTWQFNGTRENATRPVVGQVPLGRAGAASCAALNGTIPYFFGGISSFPSGASQEFNDSWVWGASHAGWWIPQVVQGAPSARDGMGGFWDPALYHCYFYGGLPATGGPSAQLYAVSVGGAAPLESIVSGPSRLTLGGVASYSLSAGGGLPPYRYRWFLNNSQTLLGTNASVVFRPLGAAVYTVIAETTDASNTTVSAVTLLFVTGGSPVTVTVSLIGFDAKGRATFHAAASGGTPPYRFRWNSSEGRTNWSTDSNWTSPVLGPGTFTFQALAVDSVGYVGAGSLTVKNQIVPPTATSLLLLAGVLAAGIVAGILFGTWLRRRRRPPSPAPPTAPPVRP